MPKFICSCGSNKYHKGRAFDGRRIYMCISCEKVHSFGLQGRKKRYSIQRLGDQFSFTKHKEWD
jgi:hypothetical protein